MIAVRGDEKAEATILRAGRRALDQRSSLASAGRQAGPAAVQDGPWQDQSGKLSASLAVGGVDASADSLKLTSGVPYARFVFYGTARQRAQPPRVDAAALRGVVARLVADDLVGE